jgi:hypothetical protein
MAIYETFSNRQKKIRGEVPDVYLYETIPNLLRIQIVHIIKDTIGKDLRGGGHAKAMYDAIHKILCKEYGLFTLKEGAQSHEQALLYFFMQCKEHEKCLDIIELTFSVINSAVSKDYYSYQQRTTSSQRPDDAISELNTRFKESGIGYQFESNELIRVDSQFIHSETVKPALQLLISHNTYRGANDEFLTAHDHYRHKRYKECINECLKSFESLMKAIHDKHSWVYNKNDTAKKLINSCLTNKLIPEYLQNQFASIRILLESGTPTVRNKEGGHGQGTEITTIPEHLASYTLHLTATNLLFLANCEEKYSEQDIKQ